MPTWERLRVVHSHVYDDSWQGCGGRLKVAGTEIVEGVLGFVTFWRVGDFVSGVGGRTEVIAERFTAERLYPGWFDYGEVA